MGGIWLQSLPGALLIRSHSSATEMVRVCKPDGRIVRTLLVKDGDLARISSAEIGKGAFLVSTGHGEIRGIIVH